MPRLGVFPQLRKQYGLTTLPHQPSPSYNPSPNQHYYYATPPVSSTRRNDRSVTQPTPIPVVQTTVPTPPPTSKSTRKTHSNMATAAVMQPNTVPAYRTTSASPPAASRKAAKASANASAPSSRPPTRSSDPFYGHEEVSVMSARFITSLFACPNVPTGTSAGSPTPTLAHFVAYALHRTRLPSIVTFAALLLLQRLKARFPAARGSSGHRLFISAFMIASKVICDDTYSNQSWGIVAQKMFALKEINQMEREMCGYLEWNLNVAGDEVVEFEDKVRSEHSPRAIAKASAMSQASSSSSDMVIPVVPKSSAHAYPTPDTTPDTHLSRPIRPVPSPYKTKMSAKTYPSLSQHQPYSHLSHLHYSQQGSTHVTSAPCLPSPPNSPHSHYLHPPSNLHSASSPTPPHFTSAYSSLQSSPASDDCKTPSPDASYSVHASHTNGSMDASYHGGVPSPMAIDGYTPSSSGIKSVDMSRSGGYEYARQGGLHPTLSGYSHRW